MNPEYLTLVLSRGGHITEHHIDCGLLNVAKGKKAGAALLWGEFITAKTMLNHHIRIAEEKAKAKS